MPLIEDLKRYASECLQIAGLTDDPEIRDRLLEMAREWTALADGHGRTAKAAE